MTPEQPNDILRQLQLLTTRTIVALENVTYQQTIAFAAQQEIRDLLLSLPDMSGDGWKWLELRHEIVTQKALIAALQKALEEATCKPAET